MIILMLRFALRAETTQAERATVLAAMRRTANLESVSFSAVGQDLGDSADGYTHAYCAGVRDLVALRRYLYDPVHLDGDLEILPHLARLSALQLSDDMDPELKEKIVAMHREKVVAYPEWGRLLDTIPR
ncbi:Stress responsive A/B Barrel Domain [Saccharopolyspora antimicrobica]|uniref:Stress responsive A/B Barrel Domain n=1 Tax=Saccharopolyspora antimicrobica TaxID=455193 RepID=A0A1I5LQB0_9PSEU|nr:Dabb family protein [Saccharopolyspora antimicrobica]RKT87866.1 stress responsive alpha/beta barrel protein [Saccharopolyspora antimicrobica]SFO99382.1 Stress responsive A/B Barrel Domain [Saccharopolyspora antimicrobica]